MSQVGRFARNKIIPELQVMMKDPKYRKEFEDWHLEYYGRPYVWKKRSDFKNGDSRTKTGT